jgi:hypothetical protein
MTSPTSTGQRDAARGRAVDGLVVTACALGPMLWRLLAGAGRWPAGDAWAYERIFATFHRTGQVVLVGWNDINLIGMLPVTELWVRVFGSGPHQLHLLGSFMGVIALLGVRHLLGTAGVRQRAVPLAVVGLSAAFVGADGTYLSDVFCMAGVAWGLAIAFHLVTMPGPYRRAALLTVVAAMCMSYAFMIRQHAAVPALAAGVVLYRHRDRRTLAWLYVACSAVVVLPAYIWRRTLDHGGVEITSFYPRSAGSGLVAMWFTLGLVGLPLVWRTPTRRAMSAWHYLILATPLAIVAAATMINAASPLARGQSVAGEFVIQGGGLGWAAALVAMWAATVTWKRILCAGSLHRSDGGFALQVIVMITVVGEALIVIASGTYFARYSIISGAMLVCYLAQRQVPSSAPASRQQRLLGVGVIAGLAVCSYVVIDFSIRGIGAVKQAAAVAECAGIAPGELDAGFVWNGVNTDGFVDSQQGRSAPADGLPPTEEQQVFVEMRRNGVLLDAPVSADPSQYVVTGPFRSEGLIPGNDEDRWLVVRPIYASALASCSAGLAG